VGMVQNGRRLCSRIPDFIILGVKAVQSLSKRLGLGTLAL